MVTVFCYGTLKRDYSAHGLIKRSPGAFLGEVTTAPRYQLYDVGSFPGMVEDDSQIGGVKGELFKIPDAALPNLDRYECVSSGLFRREEIELEDGSKALAYLFNKDIIGAKKIEDGFWNND